MNDIPKINLGDWIKIGKEEKIDAVVSRVYEVGYGLADIEFVYMQNGAKAIFCDGIWKNGCWEFRHDGPEGGYAERSAYHAFYVQILREGKYFR